MIKPALGISILFVSHKYHTNFCIGIGKQNENIHSIVIQKSGMNSTLSTFLIQDNRQKKKNVKNWVVQFLTNTILSLLYDTESKKCNVPVDSIPVQYNFIYNSIIITFTECQ